jgi:hypothetical protein
MYIHIHTNSPKRSHTQLLETCFYEWSHSAAMGRLRRAFEQLATVCDKETYTQVCMRKCVNGSAIFMRK